MNATIETSNTEIIQTNNVGGAHTYFAPIMLIAFSVVLCCSACVKTEAFLDDRQLIFVISPTRNANQEGYNYFFETAHIAEDSSFYPASVGWAFPVGLLHASETNVQVTAIIDTSLIGLYDQITGSGISSPALPSGAFELSQTSVVIKPGALVSVDSIRMQVVNVPGLDLGQKYIIPVRIESVTTEVSTRIDTLRQTLFFQVPFTE